MFFVKKKKKLNTNNNRYELLTLYQLHIQIIINIISRRVSLTK